ncbi:hypothetical protein O0L34_g6551 [Tuta absoluta]|nr:hypothetical protein O0L34_g6551 [Tuta absoluta]
MEMATALLALDRNRPAALLSDFIQLQAKNMDDLGECKHYHTHTHTHTHTHDVFSFGVVLMEMATALLALDRNRPAALLSDFIQLQAKNMDDLGECKHYHTHTHTHTHTTCSVSEWC